MNISEHTCQTPQTTQDVLRICQIKGMLLEQHTINMFTEEMFTYSTKDQT